MVRISWSQSESSFRAPQARKRLKAIGYHSLLGGNDERQTHTDPKPNRRSKGVLAVESKEVAP